jgi:HlyD family secretion protein
MHSTAQVRAVPTAAPCAAPSRPPTYPRGPVRQKLPPAAFPSTGVCATYSPGRDTAVRFLFAALVLVLALAPGCRKDTGDLVLVGTVERTLVELSAPASEVIVSEEVRRGERVAPGQVLVRLDPTFARAEVARAEATLAGARTGAATTESDLVRITGLRRSGVVSAQDLEHAQLTRDEAAARLREAEAALAAARRRLDELTIASPVAGIVDQLPFDAGERPPAGGVVAVVLDDAEPWVRVWVPEERVAGVHPGTPARIHVDGIAGPLAGHVLEVAREAEFTPHYALTERDRVYLVYQTRVAIDDAPPELRPGVPARVVLAPAAGAGAP